MFKIRTSFLCLCFSLGKCDLDAANWMKDNVAWLGRMNLRGLCIPGTHNSGMNQLNGGTAFARHCNTVNQSQSFRRQLELGVRYFDVRPVIAGGRLLTGHYTKVMENWHGGNGQSMSSIVSDINAFTQHHNELIIIKLSHSLNTDLGNTRYRGFVKAEWERLFRILDETNHMFQASPYTSFTRWTIADLTKNGTVPAVFYIVDTLFSGVFLGKRVGKGYFYPNSLCPYDCYSGMNSFRKMFVDQTEKMRNMSPARYFLLSWTLTQSPLEASFCPVGKSIEEHAKDVNSRLGMILPEVSKKAFPNIISIDYVETTLLTEIVMAINCKLFYTKS